MKTDVTDQTFDAESRTSTLPVVVEFFATWCGNCRRIAPALQALAAEFADRVRFLTVNAEENPELVDRFEITSTPTLLALDGAEPAATMIGAHPEGALREFFAAAASHDRAAATWVPADACTLPTVDQPQRVGEFEDLFASALLGSARRETTWLRLRFAGSTGLAEQVRDLTEREAQCCTFFDFQLTPGRDELTLDVRVPPEFADVLTGMERQAAAGAGPLAGAVR